MLKNEFRLISAALATILFITLCFIFAFSAITNMILIQSSGLIITGTLPLHVDGRYIRNSLNQTVWLRGVNKPEFVDDPDAAWSGSTLWNDDNVRYELDAMKSWGVNVIRCHISVELWKYDIGPDSGHRASPYCALSARNATKRLLTFAAEKGMYVVLDPYSVRCYWTGSQEDPFPFPPYALSPNASEIISSQDDFVEWWRSVARELRYYPNVLLDLWNEPGISATNMTELNLWLNVSQRCINAIREEGFNGIIIWEWFGPWCNVVADESDFPIGHGANGETFYDWLETAVAGLTDPLGNLLFDFHFYRTSGNTGLLQGDAMRQYWNSTRVWDYQQMKKIMEYCGWKWALEELKIPIMVGETGASLGWKNSNPVEHQNEMKAWKNLITIFNEWGIHYMAFWWREIGIFRLHSGPPSFYPTESGQILIEELLKK